MNIAFVTELYYPSIGGQEVRFEELGQELVARGHHVTVYAIQTDIKSPLTEKRHGIDVVRLAPSPNYKSKWFRRSPFSILRFTWALWRRLGELKKADVVIFNIWPILPHMILGWFLRGTTVVDICETRSGLFWHLVYKSFTFLPRVRFLGVNPEIIRHMIRVHGVKPERAHVAVSGVDLNCAGQPPFTKQAEQLLFFGRMTDHKNPRLLAEAFLESGIAQKGFQLHMAGDGPELSGLRSDFTTGEITFHGRVSDEAKWELLRQASLLVMPSRREGFPRVVAEGACVGTPTLSLDYPDNGTCSVVKDYSIGRICPGSKDALVSELQQFADGKVSYAAIAEHCLRDARNEFSWTTVTDSLVRFLENEVAR
jgi:glycosyltransferase involved in cell wall biosynthesis